MGYTAIQKMRIKNKEDYGINYPVEMETAAGENVSNIEKECLDFIRNACEELRFDVQKNDLTDRDGRSVSANQIPYNMEKDIDRMCMENAVHRFMQSGTAQDAFDVYFCYLEMFMGSYGKSRKMIEMLAEFEAGAGSLLMKHRDHYSHSVYVFVLGLAVYNKNAYIREAYQKYYGFGDEKKAAHHYLEYWGLSALFHDIGYPFELPFEQVKSYFGNTIKRVPFVAYKGVDAYIRLSEEEKTCFEQLLGKPLKAGTTDEVLAENIARKLECVYGKSSEDLQKQALVVGTENPEDFGGFMDHAYFSSSLLMRQLLDILGADHVNEVHLDALTAIAMHNSMYKFSITNIRDLQINKAFDIHLHPLAYILMLCDELQVWDRMSYGQNSRRELHAMGCDIEFAGDTLKALYYFDSQQEYKKDTAKGTYPKMTDAQVSFVRSIEDIIRINQEDTLKLEIDTAFADNKRQTTLYMSDSNFLHLYHFAVALNGRYAYGNTENDMREQMEADFDQLSLEYKMSNILQAKAFPKYLDAIGCFYTDKPVAYRQLERFSEEEMEIIGPMEHARWTAEKKSMGWQYDTAYVEKGKALRELTRTHTLIADDYDALEKEEQNKDTEPMNCMLNLIREYDGLRIYCIR